MKKFVALVAVAALVAFAAPAFAANPFMDVPMNHWAYDAVSQLAARGIVTGYPDGAFKGEWKATRYEMASVVARALAYVDMNKASKEDLELLKRLVVEFKDELDALGVKVEDLDKRVAVLEDDIGGWKLWGELRFDAKWADLDAVNGGAYTADGDTDFTMSRYRIWMRKTIDDKLTFIGRVGNNGGNVAWERYYIEAKMPWDVTAWIGRWLYDWEGEDGFYIDNDAWFTDLVVQGFYVSKAFNMGQFDAFVGHDEGAGSAVNVAGLPPVGPDGEGYYYGARVKFAFNEKFGLGLVGLWKNFDNPSNWNGADWTTYWAQFYVNFTPNIAFRGRYIWQEDDALPMDTNAWQAILQVDQEALGFTSLWIEYAQLDQGFFTDTDDPYANYGADVLGFPGVGTTLMLSDTDVLFVRADQTWNEKWGTFQRYVDVSRDAGAPDTTNWTFGVNYWYTPNMKFELVYDDVDYDGWVPDDNLIRLRTHVWF
jgi:hypothetical protein